MGIVAEVITTNARRPLWGYGLMVSAVLFMGGMSMVVWAHHMFLTGMGTTLTTFFQVTTFIISIPSVILISSLVLTLWGGSITFTTPMLFALAFLPMFGIGGLTGLPLGLAASDVSLHDTYYVVAHFHYLVAPGTVFALFAGIYHWFPQIAGRALDETARQDSFLGFVRLHEPDLHADVRDRPDGREPPVVGCRRKLRARAANAAVADAHDVCGVCARCVPDAFHLELDQARSTGVGNREPGTGDARDCRIPAPVSDPGSRIPAPGEARNGHILGEVRDVAVSGLGGDAVRIAVLRLT